MTLRRIYTNYLKIRWKMKRDGARLLSEEFLQDYKNHIGSFFSVMKIHNKGFSWEDWNINNFGRKKYDKYLKTTEYYAMHPLNGQYSHWIDDKLTLKYLCAGTSLDKYMPKYYFQIDSFGNVLGLSDYQEKGKLSIDELITFLENTGELAFKRIAGSLGEGFCKGVYVGGTYMLNDKVLTREELKLELQKLRDYLITEYLHPHKDMVPFCSDTVNTIRYLVGKKSNGEISLIKSFIRFGTIKSGFVENYNAGGVLCYINDNGVFEKGNLYDFELMKNIIITHHPDTGTELKGIIPLWNEVQKASIDFCEQFPQLNYLGIDFVVTSKNEVKILEINSLTSLDSLQLAGSILDSKNGSFYKERMRERLVNADA